MLRFFLGFRMLLALTWGLGFLAWGATQPASAGIPIRLARFLSPSPDGKTLAFAWRGDIWLAPLGGGEARRWTAHPADDRHPVWSPDGRYLAWASRRHGQYDIFVAEATGGVPRRLTWHQADDIPLFWTQDSRSIVFKSPRDSGPYHKDALYQISREGGEPRLFLDTHVNGAALSPDGKTLALVQGDRRAWRKRYTMPYHRSIGIWDLRSQRFQTLTPPGVSADEPSWLDPTTLVFRSEQTGVFNLWKADLRQPRPRLSPLTSYTEEGIRSARSTADGQSVLFERWDRLYRWDRTSGHIRELAFQGSADLPFLPTERRILSKPLQEYALSPDGLEVAAVLRGKIALRLIDDPDKQGRLLAPSSARESQPSWSPDSRKIVFTSARDGRSALYIAHAGSEEGRPLRLSATFLPTITRFTPPAALLPEASPSWSPDGRSIAFVRDAKDLVVRTLQGSETTVLAGWNLQTFAWSGDGRWFLLTRHDDESNADIFLLPADGSHAPINLSRHPDIDQDPVWSANGKAIAFLSRGIDQRFFLHILLPDLRDHEADPFDLERRMARWAKDFKAAASRSSGLHFRGGTSGGSSSDAAEGRTSGPRPPRKRSPRLQAEDERHSGSPPAPRPKRSPRLQAEDERRSGSPPASRPPRKRSPRLQAEDERRSGSPPAPRPKPSVERRLDRVASTRKGPTSRPSRPPFRVDTRDIAFRLRRITDLPGAAGPQEIAISPDANWIAFSIRSKDPKIAGLYKIRLDGKKLTLLLSGPARRLRFNAQGHLTFLSKDGLLHTLPPQAKTPTPIPISAEVTDDPAAIRKATFLEAWSLLQRWFYDPTFHGANWTALRDRYLRLLDTLATREDFEDAIHWMLGELSASHLGIFSKPPKGRRQTADLGLTFDPTFQGPGWKIQAVRPQSPASRLTSSLQPGDILLAVEGQAISPSFNLAQALQDRVGRTLPLQIRDLQGKTRVLSIRPVSQADAATERYNAWVAANRKTVESQSRGLLGYAHIRSMGLPSLDHFERDLLAYLWGKQGLVLDLRNNGGGWTADFLLSIFRPLPHAVTQWRGSGRGYPAQRRSFFGWHRPVLLLINERSISNAEIFAHAFRNLRLGRIVGMPTYGGVISTGAEGLVDGSIFRVPLRGWWTLPGGQNMENGPAQPDLRIPLSLEDEIQGRDPQLHAAIRDLLPQLPSSRPAGPR